MDAGHSRSESPPIGRKRKRHVAKPIPDSQNDNGENQVAAAPRTLSPSTPKRKRSRQRQSNQDSSPLHQAPTSTVNDGSPVNEDHHPQETEPLQQQTADPNLSQPGGMYCAASI